MTAIPAGHYSAAMVSEFHELSEKVERLAQIASALRLENAELRLEVVALGNENAELARRMEIASQRVSALLDRIPVAVKEAAP